MMEVTLRKEGENGDGISVERLVIPAKYTWSFVIGIIVLTFTVVAFHFNSVGALDTKREEAIKIVNERIAGVNGRVQALEKAVGEMNVMLGNLEANQERIIKRLDLYDSRMLKFYSTFGHMLQESQKP